MFTQYDRALLEKMSISYADKKETQKRKDNFLFELGRENSELKTKVELYEALIQRLLKLNPDIDDISKNELVYNGEIYRVLRYNLESCEDETKMLHIDMKCVSPITKIFKEEE